MKTSWLPALLVAALPGTALAEQLPFTTLGRGPFGPPGEAQELVFLEEHVLVTSLMAEQLDPDPEEQIDFATHQVIAVCMGTRPSGGHATTIESLELDETNTLTVRYSETAPTGAADAFQTAPFHLVLCPRTYGEVRFVRSAVPGAEQTITGEVELRGDEVRLVTPGAEGLSHLVAPAARARELARFPGRTVRVVGQARVEGEGSVLEVSRILSPERRTIGGVAQVEAGRPSLLGAAPSPVPVSGPAQSAVQAARGARVDCDAFVFTDVHGVPVEAHVEGVKGAAIVASSLRGAAWLLSPGDGGSVRAGEDVVVLRSLGPVARVRSADGDEGWVHLSRLRVGQPLLVGPGVTPGLVGAVERY